MTTTETSDRTRPSLFAQLAGNALGAILVGTIEDNTNSK